MPRPLKKRAVCCVPQNREFSPKCPAGEQPVVLTVDEYETIRLMDLEDTTQEECAAQMQVSRTTVQGVYNTARRKIADALVHGKRLEISGGDYVICSHYNKTCGSGCHGHCRKRQQHECRRREIQ